MWTNDGPSLYLTADKSRVVEEGDPDAAFLLVAAGGQLPMAEAEKHGLTKKSKVAPAVEEKATAPAQDKSKTAPANKSKG